MRLRMSERVVVMRVIMGEAVRVTMAEAIAASRESAFALFPGWVVVDVAKIVVITVIVKVIQAS